MCCTDLIYIYILDPYNTLLFIKSGNDLKLYRQPDTKSQTTCRKSSMSKIKLLKRPPEKLFEEIWGKNVKHLAV